MVPIAIAIAIAMTHMGLLYLCHSLIVALAVQHLSLIYLCMEMQTWKSG